MAIIQDVAELEDSPIVFDGDWREYAPIAFTNLLLTIVTMGIYRFWATARTRRYLWSRTHVMGEPLEWTGTGWELFKGLVGVVILIGVPLFLVNLVAQSFLLHGQVLIGAAIQLVVFAAVYSLIGVALFRALRYRLSRTYWRGIRGGSADQGWDYGPSWLWRNAVAILPFGLLIPWAMVTLWNRRWNAMSFGPLAFDADAHAKGLWRRFLFCYLTPFLGMIVGLALIASVAVGGRKWAVTHPAEMMPFLIVAMLSLYAVMAFGFAAFYAKYLRQVIGATRLGDLQFGFDAGVRNWIGLYLGDFALTVVTLGFGALFIGYRHWKFYARHLSVAGTIDLEGLTQSTLPEPTQGEGLLDAFDVGAF